MKSIQSIWNRFANWKYQFRLDTNSTKLILVVVLLLFIVVLIVKNASIKPPAATPVAEAMTLEVNNVTLASPRIIAIEFTDDVDLHVLSHRFSLSPDIKGTLTGDKDGKKFFYRANDNFPPSSQLVVRIDAGLESRHHRTLIKDSVTSLSTDVGENQLQFIIRCRVHGIIYFLIYQWLAIE